MGKKLVNKIILTAVTCTMIVTSSTLVAFAQSNDDEENTVEVQISDSELLDNEIISEDENVEEQLGSELLPDDQLLETEESTNENQDAEITNEKDEVSEGSSGISQSNQHLFSEEMDEYYIKDAVLREIINERLYKEEGHNPTPKELETITYLKISPKSGSGFNSKNYLKIDSFEGMEYLINLTNLIIENVIMPESEIENISKSTSISNLFIEYSFFTGRNDVSTTLVNTSINEGPRDNVELSFSSYVSFEPLSNLSNLKNIQIVKNGSVYDGTEFGKALTGFDLTGWEKLTELNYIWLEGASSFNDNSLEFVKYLPKLNEITLYNTSLNSLEHFADLNEENMRLLQLMSNDVLDYTPVIDKKYFTGATENLIKDVLEFYTEEEVNGELRKYISVNTGIVLGDNLKEVKLGSYSMFQNSMKYSGYENIDGILYLNFEIKDLVNFKHKSIDEVYHGFMVTVTLTYNTQRGTTGLEFVLPINIGKRADFIFAEDDIQSLFFKPFELIEPIENPTRPGFKFVEWTEDKEGNTSFDFSLETYDNQTIYAQWEENDTFTVTFDSNGGTVVSPLTDVEKNSVIDEPEVPTKKGHAFVGWYKDVDLNNMWDFSVDRITENTTLYAKWESEFVGKMYNLDAKDGTINLADLNDSNDLVELQEKIIEVTQAKGYKIDRDGTRTDLPVYVKDIDSFYSTKGDNYKNVELTLIDPNKRLISSDDVDEVNLIVRVYVNEDIDAGGKPINPGDDNTSSKPTLPEDTNTSDKPTLPTEDTNTSEKPVVPTEDNVSKNPNTGIFINSYSYLVILGVGLASVIVLKKRKQY